MFQDSLASYHVYLFFRHKNRHSAESIDKRFPQSKKHSNNNSRLHIPDREVSDSIGNKSFLAFDNSYDSINHKGNFKVGLDKWTNWFLIQILISYIAPDRTGCYTLRSVEAGCCSHAIDRDFLLILIEEVKKMPDVIQLFEEMSEANQITNRYAYSLSVDGGPNYYTEGEFDQTNRSRYSKTTIGDVENPHSVELYWIGDTACGKPIHINHWFNVHTFNKLPQDFMTVALSLVSREDEKDLLENSDKWVIEARPNLERLHGDTENLLREIFDFEKLKGYNGDQFVAKLIQTLRQVDFTVQYILSRDTIELNECRLIFSFNDRIVTISAKFWNFNSESIKISFPEASLRNEGKKVLFGFLFLKPDKAGWAEYNHMLITAEAIKLIAAFDKKAHYEEIYKDYSAPNYYGSAADAYAPDAYYKKPNHPSVNGAWAEDAWDNIRTLKYHRFYEKESIPALTYRSFNHFGYGEDGLQWEDYFYLVNEKVRKPLNEKFVSALYWGKEDGKKHEETKFWVVDSCNKNGECTYKKCSYKNDPMNFEGAIKVYGDGDDQGRIEGYRRMGHVLHLLQDLAQPDHAQKKDHAASGNTLKEAIDKFKLCMAQLAQDIETTTIVGSAAAAASGGIVLVVMAISTCIKYSECDSCKDNDDCKNIVGFERLIKDNWGKVIANAPWIKPNYVDTFQRHLASEGYNYDTVFKNMGQDATDAANRRNLSMPLGLDPMTISAIAYGYLALTASDDSDEQQVVESTNIEETIPGLRPKIDTSNPNSYKPYIELAQEVINKAILRSASMLIHFLDIINPPPIVQSVAAVKGVAGLIPSGYAKFEQNQSEGDCSKIFLAYKAKWDNSIKIRTKIIEKDEPLSSNHSIYVFVEFGPKLWPDVSRQMKEDSLILSAISPRGFFSPIDIQVQASTDKSSGEFYWGSFIPPKLGGEYDILFEIKGMDDTAHLTNRGQQVQLLDSDPSTVAHVDAEKAPEYPFIDYEPGSDKNHLIHIARNIVKDQLERNDNFAAATAVNLSTKSISVKFKELTIDSVKDVDFFHIKYESSKKDDSVKLSGKQGLTAGLHYDIHAPKLDFWIFEKFNSCISIRMYHKDKTVFRDFKIVNNSTLPFCTIEAPSVELDGNKELYIEIKNPDYKMQGPLAYDLNINYIPAITMMDGKLLYELWKFLGYPTPLTFPPAPIRGGRPFEFVGNPPDSVIYHDQDLLIKHLNQFANNFHPSTEMTRRDKEIWSARFTTKIGMLTKNLGREKDAIDFFRDSSTLLEVHNLTEEANITKQRLKESLINTNQIRKARNIIINRGN